MAVPYSTGPVHCWVIVPDVRQFRADAVGARTSAQSALSANVPLGTASSIAPIAISNLSKRALYLGTCERAPRAIKRRTFSPVHNDLAGPSLPFDEMYTGEEGWVIGDLTRWNENVYRTIASLPFPNGSEGLDIAGGRGTLMMTEGAGYGVILRYPFYDQHPLYAANGMAAGERYLCCYLKGEDTHLPGLQANKRQLAFYAIPVYIPQYNNFVLYDHNVTGIPALAPN